MPKKPAGRSTAASTPGIVWNEPAEIPVAFARPVIARLRTFCADRERSWLLARIRFGSFVDPKHKILYVDTPKVASTAILQFFNDLHGRDAIRPFTGRLRETKPEMFIHSRKNAALQPLSAMPVALQPEILESDAWLRFAFVRNPFTRIFSFWLNKLFLVEPDYEQAFALLGRKPPDRLTRPEDSILFGEFVRGVVARLDATGPDQHLMLQERLLLPSFFNLNHIGKIESFAEDFAVVIEQVRRHGGTAVMPERRNPSLEDWRQFYEPDLAAIVAEHYGSDFTRFGYEPTIEAKILRAAKKAPGIQSLRDRIDLYDEIMQRNRLFARLYDMELGSARMSIRLNKE
ncbi:MAG: sulfotransferase family protein [Rhodospirillaceae bacterium]|nr:sulfotransferase family protein [Rhodospirillaceae bacterium]